MIPFESQLIKIGETANSTFISLMLKEEKAIKEVYYVQVGKYLIQNMVTFGHISYSIKTSTSKINTQTDTRQ